MATLTQEKPRERKPFSKKKQSDLVKSIQHKSANNTRNPKLKKHK